MSAEHPSVIPLNITIIVIFLNISRSMTLIFKAFLILFIFIRVEIIISWMSIATDINYLSAIIVFASLYNRMKIIRQSMEMNTIPVNIVGRNEIKTKTRLIRKCHLRYIHLLDNLFRVDCYLQCMVILILFHTIFNYFIYLLTCG